MKDEMEKVWVHASFAKASEGKQMLAPSAGALMQGFTSWLMPAKTRPALANVR